MRWMILILAASIAAGSRADDLASGRTNAIVAKPPSPLVARVQTPAPARISVSDVPQRPPVEGRVALEGGNSGVTGLSAENQAAARERLRRSLMPLVPEDAGGAMRYLRRKPTLRGLRDLFDPFAPLARDPARMPSVWETRRVLDYGAPDSLRGAVAPPVPRAFRDPITHEYGIRLW